MVQAYIPCPLCDPVRQELGKHYLVMACLFQITSGMLAIFMWYIHVLCQTKCRRNSDHIMRWTSGVWGSHLIYLVKACLSLIRSGMLPINSIHVLLHRHLSVVASSMFRWWIVMKPHNRQQMDHKRWYECRLASRQVSVLALCYLMKPDGIIIVRGRMDGDSVWILYIG